MKVLIKLLFCYKFPQEISSKDADDEMVHTRVSPVCSRDMEQRPGQSKTISHADKVSPHHKYLYPIRMETGFLH